MYLADNAERATVPSLQQKSAHCNTLQHTATRTHFADNIERATVSIVLQHAATRCNTLQHTATRTYLADNIQRATVPIFLHVDHLRIQARIECENKGTIQ